jgi:hypothetical protein
MRVLCLARLVAVVLVSTAATLSAQPIEIGSRLELMVDRHLIDRLDGTSLKLNPPRPAGVAIRYDNPWEQVPTGTATIIEEGGIHRLYYTALPMDYKSESGESNLCYAESRDGVTWVKPRLGLVEFRGSRDNNILMAGNTEDRYSANFAPFIDRRPGVPADERFKAVGGVWPKGMFVLVSADGIRWRKWRPDPVFSAGAFDSQNVAFWSESERCYVLFFRVFSGTDHTKITKWEMAGYRTIAKTTSPDLVTWSKPQRMSFGASPLEELYENRTHPYPRAPHLYLAYPMRFVPGRRFLSDERLNELKVLPSYLNIKGHSHDIPNEVSDTVLMTSRGGYRYDRTFMEALVRPGNDDANWVSRNGIAATGTVVTGPTEMSIYVGQHYMQPTAYLGRFALRLDGFASVSAPYAGGEMLTKPIVVGGKELMLNYATSAPGGIRVEVQEADGEPIPGFTLAESRLMVGDSVEQAVRWTLKTDLAGLVGRPVRLRFVMKDADLYALRFRP